jgi:putative ABC transport system permease protein
MLADLMQDIRYGFRSLVKNPIFSLVAAFTIALGIGANVVVFTLIERILLSPLPYKDPDRIVRMVQSYPEIGLQTWGLSPATFTAYYRNQQSFDALAAYQNTGGILTGSEGTAEYVLASRVTCDFFQVFGVDPILGRTFAPDEGTQGKDNVVVLSNSLWKNRFGGDPQIVGKQVSLSGVQTQVIGVMPPNFGFPTPETQLWTPVGLDPQAIAPFTMASVGKLKYGTSISAAGSDTTSIIKRAAAENPGIILKRSAPPPDSGLKTVLMPLKEYVVGTISTRLWIAQLAVGLVLLIACANVANLLIGRAAKRTPEVALRLELGATPGRIIRQLLTESVLLALIGAAVGVGLAWTCLRALTQIYAEGIPRIQEASIGGAVLAVTVITTVATGLLFGVVPAFRAYWLGVKEGMVEGQRGTVGHRNKKLNSTLVVVQLALSLVLLVGAGLVLKSFQNLMRVDPGFAADKVLTMIVPVSTKKGTPEQLVEFYKRVLSEVRAVPGVNAAATASNLPFSGRAVIDGHNVEGMEAPNGNAPQAEMKVVSPDYFKTMGMPILQGHDFDGNEVYQPPRPAPDLGVLVAIVDQRFVRAYFPDGNVIGKRVRTNDPTWARIIGVVGEVKEQSLSTEPSMPHIYWAANQGRFAWGLSRDQNRLFLVINTDNPAAVIPAVRERIRALDPEVPVYSVSTMSENIIKKLGPIRLINFLLTAFSAIALLLAAIGTYGVMSVSVSSRASEFAIRQALGAEPRSLLISVLRQGLILAAIGIVIGLVGSWFLSKAIASQLFGVSATDPLVLIATSVILIAVALLASFLPARRASQTDPVVVLRES